MPCNIIIMDKLTDITIDNTLSLTVTCQVDQHLLGKNFTTILNALRELQANQLKTDAQVKNLTSMKDRIDQLAQKVQMMGSNVVQSNGDGASISDGLLKRIDKNENNIMDNIKDINLINKDINQLRRLIDQLRNQSPSNQLENDKSERVGYEVSDIASNMSKELNASNEKLKELELKLLKAQDTIDRHEKDIKQLQDGRDKKNGQPQTPSAGRSDKDLEDLKRDLREKLQVINKKINNLQSDTDNHEQQISDIKEILADRIENKEEIGEAAQTTQNKEEVSISKQDLNDLKKKIDQVDRRQDKDVKSLNEEVNNLKLLLRSQGEKIESKTSIEEEGSRINQKKSTIQRDDLNDRLNDLILKVNYLEKLISGSKTNIEDKTTDRLPAINRPKRKDPNLTGYQEKEKSGISKRDLSDLKAELEAWIKSLFDQSKDHENLQALELKIQEIKRNLQRKADAEGTKKGFAFLENKITQLYLFLTQPDTEDAMIVRKGFNCLSCSKRVQKLRGKIGPKVNWNNMTATNYSPPRVGYSKPMGETSLEKEEDV